MNNFNKIKKELIDHIEGLYHFYRNDDNLKQYYNHIEQNVNNCETIEELEQINKSIYDPKNYEDNQPKKCFNCEKLLNSVFGDWQHIQPKGGGEVKFNFSYGSRHDESSYVGVVCDECADKFINKLEKI